MNNFLSNKAYDVLKFIGFTVIPLIGEAYIRLAKVWDLPLANEINETALVIVFIFSVLLGYSTLVYNRVNNEISIEDFKDGDK